MPLKLDVIVASTRPGRGGLPVSKWVFEHASRHGAFETHFVDLAEVNLPLLDEPNPPRLRQYTKPHTRAFSAIIDAADAFVVVTPEYNHASPPALVNAFDYLVQEWAYKPLAFVSYGGVSGGLRAAQMSKLIVAGLRMMPIPDSVSIQFYSQYIKDGVFEGTDVHARSLDGVLTELARWATALATLRAPAAMV